MHRATVVRSVAGFIASAAFATGCSRGPFAQGSPGGSVSAVASAPATAPVNSATPGTLALGERITSPLIPLADIAKSPAQFQGQTVATSGKVTAVCQEMGCWMQLEDGTGQAHVRMHGHTFFVPKTAPGHLARVQGTLVKQAGADDCEEGKAAKVELDATGVEID